MAVKVAAWPAWSVVLVDVVHAPPVTLWQVGPEVRAPAGAVWVSVTPTAMSVTLPVLVTMNWYEMSCPTALYGPVDVTVLTVVSAGEEVVGTVAVEGGEVTGGPVGGVPVEVAESATEPLSRSAWVMA